MQAVAFAARQVLDELLLRRPAEIETRYVSARWHFVAADDNIVEPVGQFFPYRLAAVEIVTRLVDVGDLHGIADFDRSLVERFLLHHDPKQRGLAGAVGPDDADDTPAWQFEFEVLVQQLIAVGLLAALDLDHHVSQPGSGGNVKLLGFRAFLVILRG